MALRVRLPVPDRLSLGYSIERLGDGMFFDFNSHDLHGEPRRR